MADLIRRFVLLAILMVGVSMGYGLAATDYKERVTDMTSMQLADDLAIVRKGRILFSHHCVGANIIMGIKRLDADVPGESHIRLSTLDEAATAKGPMFIHFSGGQNGEPKTKIDSFAATIRGETRLKPDLAFMKFCYVDFNPQTDVGELFEYYRNAIEVLKREHPEIRFVHVSVPLTVQPTGLKARIYRMIGREVWEDAANVRRAEFNRLLKENFGADLVFDLARVEALAPDGRLTTFEQGGQIYLSLYPGYAEVDGEHLNTTGQQVAGAAIIRFIAEKLKGSGSAHSIKGA
jgi:hypothetical protein